MIQPRHIRQNPGDKRAGDLRLQAVETASTWVVRPFSWSRRMMTLIASAATQSKYTALCPAALTSPQCHRLGMPDIVGRAGQPAPTNQGRCSHLIPHHRALRCRPRHRRQLGALCQSSRPARRLVRDGGITEGHVGLMPSHDRDGLALLGLRRQELHKLLDDAYAFWGQGLSNASRWLGSEPLRRLLWVCRHRPCSPQIGKGISHHTEEIVVGMVPHVKSETPGAKLSTGPRSMPIEA